jgi:hypothetical protein
MALGLITIIFGSKNARVDKNVDVATSFQLHQQILIYLQMCDGRIKSLSIELETNGTTN